MCGAVNVSILTRESVGTASLLPLLDVRGPAALSYSDVDAQPVFLFPFSEWRQRENQTTKTFITLFQILTSVQQSYTDRGCRWRAEWMFVQRVISKERAQRCHRPAGRLFSSRRPGIRWDGLFFFLGSDKNYFHDVSAGLYHTCTLQTLLTETWTTPTWRQRKLVMDSLKRGRCFSNASLWEEVPMRSESVSTMVSWQPTWPNVKLWLIYDSRALMVLWHFTC